MEIRDEHDACWEKLQQCALFNAVNGVPKHILGLWKKKKLSFYGLQKQYGISKTISSLWNFLTHQYFYGLQKQYGISKTRSSLWNFLTHQI